MTPRPRLLVAPALLAVAALLVALALLGEADDGVLALAVAVLVLGTALAVWTARTLAHELDSVRGEAAAQAETLAGVFAAETASVMVVTDAAGVITRFNPGAEAVVGVGENLALGQTPAFFLEETDISSWALAMRTEGDFAAVAAGLVASDQQQPLDWRFVRPDGERRVMSMTISTIHDAHGEVAGFLCAGRDVTNEGDTESGTEQFLATMSLELRAPMASVLGYAELLQEELDSPGVSADARTFVDRIERNGQRMLLLIQDLLMLTRVEDPALELVRDEVDLRTLVSAAYDDLRARTDGRRLEVSLRLPPDPVLQECDAKLVAQVVTQVMLNAAKFTPDGGRIMVSLKSNGSMCRIVVGDTGLGISQTDRERLFSRFFRSHQPEVRQVQGSGLGLAIVHAVVTAHGGSVSVDSELGRGSTFVVELPCRLAGNSSRLEPVAVAPTMAV